MTSNPITTNAGTPDDLAAWRQQWSLRPDTIYLNHGSFGPPPKPVLLAQQAWKTALDEQPMDFFVRRYEPAWRHARHRLAQWMDTDDSSLVFVENATHGMNVVADSFPLAAGDQVLLTNHEYGAVVRIWQRACRRANADAPRVADLLPPLNDVDKVVDALFAQVTARTRLIVVSHVTSATAVILPVQEICRRASRLGIAVCIDGPHAPAQVPLHLGQLAPDFYVASCHKWLSAPFGSGFLFAAPRWHSHMRTTQLSWGLLPPESPTHWTDEFMWSGTRDSSAYFAIPAAIDFLESFGSDRFRAVTHELARYARQRIVDLSGLDPIVPDDPDWYGTMAHVPLPPGDARSLQRALWEFHRIEVPVVEWNGARYIRVSCHLYNERAHIDALVDALRERFASERRGS